MPSTYMPVDRLLRARAYIYNCCLLGRGRLSSPFKRTVRGMVSIITPTHNRPALLKDAVECVQKQAYNNWEHLIVSDGYDRRVEEFVNGLQDARIRFFYTMPTFAWGNPQRNYALLFARGEFVCFLDDDNTIEKDYLKEMVSCFDSDEIGYAICRIRHDFVGVIPSLPYHEPRPRDMDWLNFMARREIAERTERRGIFRYSSDYHFIRQVSGACKGRFIDKILGEHRGSR